MKKELLLQILLILQILLLKLVQGIETNYNETFILPQYTYIEFLRSTVKLLESEYEPGSISAFLYLSAIKPQKTNPVQKINNLSIQNQNELNNNGLNQNLSSNSIKDGGTDLLNTYDLLMFSSPSDTSFQNYIKAMQNQQWEISTFEKICQPCSSCYEPMSDDPSIKLINFTSFLKNTALCCTGCSTNDVIAMNILGQQDSVQFKDFEAINNSPMIIIIDNTPFPNGDASNLGEIYFSSQYKIAITPNEQYFTATLVLCIVFGVILLFGSVFILSMRRQYQQAKSEEATRNIVNPENKFIKKQN